MATAEKTLTVIRQPRPRTNFVLVTHATVKDGNGFERVESGQGCMIADLLDALNAHVKESLCEDEQFGEYEFDNVANRIDKTADQRIPGRWHRLFAYAIPGSCEGYYVHVAMSVISEDEKTCQYISLGFGKTWSYESAFAIANATQRFLDEASWN